MTKGERNKWGHGTVYQLPNGKWIGTFDHGVTASGNRRRVKVTADTETTAWTKLRKRERELKAGTGTVGQRVTVKTWAETYLAMRVRDLSPKAYRAAESPIRKWVVPTIGHKRLAQLTPADIRAVHDACRKADRQPADVHRALHTMLEAAVGEGHPVGLPALKVKAPVAPKSDRMAMSVDEGLACLKAAAEMPHGSRWLFTLLYGQRQGECLGLTWDAIDSAGKPGAPFGEAIIEWQLQSLPYDGDGRKDKSGGFRVPDGHESIHLVDAYHLVRPKSRSGYRVAPLLEPVRDALLAWRDVAPENPWGLVWPRPNGRPMRHEDDRAEWKALQTGAGVSHPAGRPYHVHECRNFAATMLLDAEVPEHVITDLLGHSALAQSLKYRTRRREPLLEAMQRVGERLQLGR